MRSMTTFSVNPNKPKVTVIDTFTIPSIVDLRDLQDKSRGHFIEAEAKAVLEVIMKGLAPGRYGKEFISKKLTEEYGPNFNLNLPNVGIVKEPNGQLYAVYKAVIGKGGFGKVRPLWDLKSDQWKVNKIEDKSSDAVGRETQVLSALKRTGVVVTREKQRPVKTKQEVSPVQEEAVNEAKRESYTQFNLIMDYVDGINLAEFLTSHSPISAVRLVNIATQIVKLVADLHEKGYLHCDLKPSNLMYNPVTGEVTLIDFGLVVPIKEMGNYSQGGRGTAGYRAPEMDDKTRTVTYSEKIDTYSLGVILYELLGFKSIQGKLTTTAFMDDAQLKKLLEDMMDPTQIKRPSLKRKKEEAESVLSKLEELRDDLISVSPKIVGLIYVDDYLKASPSQKRAFVVAVESVEAIYLIDNQKNTDIQEYRYSQVRKQIEADMQGMHNKLLPAVIAKRVYLADDPNDVIDIIREEEKQNEQKQSETTLSHICYFHTDRRKGLNSEKNGAQSVKVDFSHRNYKSEIRDRAIPVAPYHLDEVYRAIHDDLGRYKESHGIQVNANGELERTPGTKKGNKAISKKAQFRVQTLLKALTTIQEYKEIRNPQDKVRYPQLFQNIEEWEKAIVKHNQPHRPLAWARGLFMPPPSTAISLSNVRENLKTRMGDMPKMKSK